MAFLIGDQPHYDQIADVNLPPALSRDNKNRCDAETAYACACIGQEI